MKRDHGIKGWRLPGFLAAVLLSFSGISAATEPGYSTSRASPDGIGKVYMGREISHVMGHLGAGWLERPTRDREERTALLIANLDLQADDTVVDLGAGTGYFSFPIAARVDRGRVLAVDIQPEMLAIIQQRAEAESVTNIETVLAAEQNPNIPAESADLVLLVDAYHEFSYPREVMQGVMAGLKPGGRVVLVEYRGEDRTVPIKPLHKMTEAQARRELEAIGFEFIENQTYLPLQHVLLFAKPRP